MAEETMRIVAISATQSTNESKLVDAHHQLRARIFAERLGWEVDVRDGRECDVFDELQPTYILAIQGDVKVAG
jgi:N-acyl-L-homoserine lactone synthetase